MPTHLNAKKNRLKHQKERIPIKRLKSENYYYLVSSKK